MSLDHLLLIGFGGPTKPEEITPFLEEVTRGLPIPPARINEVAHHYEVVGGRSPYNEYTLRLFNKLEAALRARDVTVPMFLGMRHWHPFLKDTIAGIARRDLTHGLGVILAPHRSDASFNKYVRAVDEAKAAASTPAPQYTYLPPWHDHPLFIEAQADEVRKTLSTLHSTDRPSVHVLFSAHSIPVEMAQQSRYVEEIECSSRTVATVLSHESWSVAYQSRSGNPRQPWLEPDVASAMRTLHARGVRQVVVVPIGFLCDNVEVLFDLDVEAREEATRIGLGFARASTVMDHPRFVQMLAQLIEGALRPQPVSR